MSEQPIRIDPAELRRLADTMRGGYKAATEALSRIADAL